MRVASLRRRTLLILLLLGLPAYADDSRLLATVLDPGGKPLPGVRVSLSDPDEQDDARILRTNKRGQFSLIFTETSDVLEVRLQLDGYAPVARQLQADDSGKAELVMRPLEPGEIAFPGPAGPQAREAFERGVAATKAEDWASAQEAFARMAELAPELHQSWLKLASAEYNLGHYDGALQCAKKALSMQPGLPSAERIVSDAHTMLGRTAETSAGRGEHEESPRQAARLAFQQATELTNQGRDEQALDGFEKALALDPEYAEAHYELGLALLRLGEHEKARKHLACFAELAPSSPKVPVAQTLLQQSADEP